MQTNRKKKLLYPMSRIAPKRDDIDSVEFSKCNFGNRRAFDVLMQAQFYWNHDWTFPSDHTGCNESVVLFIKCINGNHDYVWILCKK